MMASGYSYRLHDKRLAGKPDLVFPGRRIALFVNGCFFHQHPGCRRARLPKTRLEFWEPKLRGNAERDGRGQAELKAAGWTVLVIWECETEKPELIDKIGREIVLASPIKHRPDSSGPPPNARRSQPLEGTSSAGAA